METHAADSSPQPEDELAKLILEIRKFQVGPKRLSENDVTTLAREISKLRKEPDGIDSILTKLYEERRVEQSYLLSWLPLWLVAYGASVGLSAALIAHAWPSLTELSWPSLMGLAGSAIGPIIVTVFAISLRGPIRNALDAIDFRHLEIVLLTELTEGFKLLGFWWRMRGHSDDVHRSGFRVVRGLIWLMTAVSWTLPALAALRLLCAWILK